MNNIPEAVAWIVIAAIFIMVVTTTAASVFSVINRNKLSKIVTAVDDQPKGTPTLVSKVTGIVDEQKRVSKKLDDLKNDKSDNMKHNGRFDDKQ